MRAPGRELPEKPRGPGGGAATAHRALSAGNCAPPLARTSRPGSPLAPTWSRSPGLASGAVVIGTGSYGRRSAHPDSPTRGFAGGGGGRSKSAQLGHGASPPAHLECTSPQESGGHSSGAREFEPRLLPVREAAGQAATVPSAGRSQTHPPAGGRGPAGLAGRTFPQEAGKHSWPGGRTPLGPADAAARS